ncbi:MAG: hypothetical protein GY927_17670 [bacterium]|nr:hypothetical protein [bacterium]
MLSFSRLRSGIQLTKLKSQLLTRFEQLDIDGNGISKSDLELQEQIRKANMRANNIRNWAKNDLDGNAFVTRRELRILLSRKVPRTLRFAGERVPTTAKQRTNLTKKAVDEAMKADIDEDGAISMQEAIGARSNSRISRHIYSRYSIARKLPTPLDVNRDGTVSQAEIGIAIDRILKRLDTNRDGILNRDEVQYYHQLRRQAKKVLPL